MAEGGTMCPATVGAASQSVCLFGLAPSKEHLFAISTHRRPERQRVDTRRASAGTHEEETVPPCGLQAAELTCSSVQDLGLKEDARVLVSDAGEEQTLGLHRTARNNHLRNTDVIRPMLHVHFQLISEMEMPDLHQNGDMGD